MPSKNIKFILKFKLSNTSKSLDSKISTILGQCRINSNDFFNFFQHKVCSLKLKNGVEIQLKVVILVYDFDDFTVYIKMPSFTSLLTHFFHTTKCFTHPGFFYKYETKRNHFFNYILTPYLLYEIVNYKYVFENVDNLYLSSFYKKHLSSLKSKGVNLYIC